MCGIIICILLSNLLNLLLKAVSISLELVHWFHCCVIFHYTAMPQFTYPVKCWWAFRWLLDFCYYVIWTLLCMSLRICVHAFLFGICLKVKLLGHISTLGETDKLSKWLYQFILLVIMYWAPNIPHLHQQGIINWVCVFFLNFSLGNNF